MDHEFVERRAERHAEAEAEREARQQLQVGAADDRAERDADRIADRVPVMRVAPPAMSGGSGARSRIRRNSAVGAEGGPLDGDTTQALQAARGGGTRIAPGVQQHLAETMGADVGGVRLHAGSTAADLNDRMQAEAFTIGNDVFFRDGLPDPGTRDGMHLLAHEVAHTVQQGSSPLSPPRRQTQVDPEGTRRLQRRRGGQLGLLDGPQGHRRPRRRGRPGGPGEGSRADAHRQGFRRRAQGRPLRPRRRPVGVLGAPAGPRDRSRHEGPAAVGGSEGEEEGGLQVEGGGVPQEARATRRQGLQGSRDPWLPAGARVRGRLRRRVEGGQADPADGADRRALDVHRCPDPRHAHALTPVHRLHGEGRPAVVLPRRTGPEATRVHRGGHGRVRAGHGRLGPVGALGDAPRGTGGRSQAGRVDGGDGRHRPDAGPVPGHGRQAIRRRQAEHRAEIAQHGCGVDERGGRELQRDGMDDPDACRDRRQEAIREASGLGVDPRLQDSRQGERPSGGRGGRAGQARTSSTSRGTSPTRTA